jgi:hypothetical protein
LIRKRFKYLTCLVVVLMGLNLAGCGTTAKSAASSSKAASSGLFTQLVEYGKEDTDASWDASSATKITLQGNSAVVDGAGASSDGSQVTIAKAGTYVLKGKLSNGQVIISAGEKDKIRLVLNGVTLSCSDSSPLYTKQAGKTIITLAKGTTNSLSDGSTYKNTTDNEPDSTIFSQCDLTINGTGSLTVNGQYKNAIGTKDDLVITGGKITVNAVNDGLQGHDSVAVKSGTLTIKAGKDGIQSNNDQDTAKGWISLDGGAFNIMATEDGIQAETILQINGGKFNLITGGGSAKAVKKTNNDFPGGRMNNTNATASTEETASAKALKGGKGVAISNGTVTIDSADDAIHSNGDVAIKGGTFNISAGDDAVHADDHVNIDGGTIKVAQSYEGLEGAYITVKGGNIHINASDDGFNAAGGNDSSGQQQGRDNFNAAGDYEINISGGYIYVNANGDGIDSNGALNIDGGTIIVDGPTNNGNASLDYNGASKITGGTLVAAGSSGMAQAPGTSSTQNSLLVYYTAVQKAGTLVNLSDTDGKSILIFAPSKDYQSIVLSMPGLEKDKTYTLSSGGTCSGTNKDGLYTGGTYASGTKLTDVKISGTVTSIADNGSAVTGRSAAGGPGGHPGQGNHQGQPPQGQPQGNPPGQPPQNQGQPQGQPPSN